jgi:serine phosphatase RsbU (regulator of sigma subunit)
MAAALLAGRVNGFVRNMVKEAEHPCQVVTELNCFISSHFNGLGVFVTFHCLEINLITMQISYAGCGHPPALLCHVARNQCEKLQSQHEIIGVSPEFSEGCRIDQASISSGDRLLLYTDGVIETRNLKGDFFGIEGMESLLKTADASENSPQLLDRLFKELQMFRSGEPKDDILAIAVRFL